MRSSRSNTPTFGLITRRSRVRIPPPLFKSCKARHLWLAFVTYISMAPSNSILIFNARTLFYDLRGHDENLEEWGTGPRRCTPAYRALPTAILDFVRGIKVLIAS